jgi:hypothetical protein
LPLELQSTDLETFFRLLTIASDRARTGGTSSEAVEWRDYKVVFDFIRKQVERDSNHLSRAHLGRLGRPIEVAVLLKKAPENAYSIFRTISDALNQVDFIAGFTEEESWLQALEFACSYHAKSDLNIFGVKAGTRGAAVADALRRLEAIGFEYNISPYGVGLTSSSLDGACRNIEKIIKRIGGLNVAKGVFRHLEKSGKTFRGLFLYGRNVNQLARVRPPTPPWSYIYNLAIKYLDVPPSSKHIEGDWHKLIALATDVGASIDVEEYLAYAWLSISPYLVDLAIADHTQYDELFAFQQWSTEGASQLFDWWLDSLIEADCSIPFFTPEDWKSFSRSLLDNALPYEPTITLPSHHSPATASASTAGEMLRKLSCSASQVNRQYHTPLQSVQRDAAFYPVVALRQGRYFVPPRGVAARGLYERLYALMRDQGDNDLENKYGFALERLTHKVLCAAGHPPTIANKFYNHPTRLKELEIDFVVEESDQVILLECKKKALTRPARGLATIDALADVTHSFIAALNQMLRHEIALRVTSRLTLTDGSTISLNRRKTERIAITLLDYGSLQNRQFVRNIVRAFFGVELASSDPVLHKKVSKITGEMKELHASLIELAAIEGVEFAEFLRRHEFGTAWLSVDQLALMIKGQTSLTGYLRQTRHITFQTGDLFNEFANWHKMQIGQKDTINK